LMAFCGRICEDCSLSGGTAAVAARCRGTLLVVFVIHRIPAASRGLLWVLAGTARLRRHCNDAWEPRPRPGDAAGIRAAAASSRCRNLPVCSCYLRWSQMNLAAFSSYFVIVEL